MELTESAGANESPGEGELERYLANRFQVGDLAWISEVPLPDEASIALWREWCLDAARQGAYEVLKSHLPQLSFPIAAGMQNDPDYRAVVCRGLDPRGLAGATGLALRAPHALQLRVHPSPAGGIPVLSVFDREDFVALVRALGKGNEPVELPASLGAVTITGYTNWRRIDLSRRAFESSPAARDHSWDEEFTRLRNQEPERFQDRFVILSDGPYSAVPANEMGLSEQEWRARSMVLRREHEFAHYLTRRIFGSMRSHLHDELIADYAGITAVFGHFAAGLFLRFMGLDQPDRLRQGARAWMYRGQPPLSTASFAALCDIVRQAAQQVEQLDRLVFAGQARDPLGHLAALATLAAHRLDELAAPGAGSSLARETAELAANLRSRLA